MEHINILQELCNAFGPSTYEDEVLKVIKSNLGNDYNYIETPHKNLIAFKEFDKNKKTIFFQAHTDELCFRPYKYREDGFVEITTLSPIPNTANHHRIKFMPTNIEGILIADLKDNKKKKYFLDIGAKNAEEAEALLPLFSNGAYSEDFVTGDCFLSSRNFDDRAGCAAIVKTLKNIESLENNVNVVGLFTAREETGNWPIPEVVKICEKREISPDIIFNLECCPGGPTPLEQDSIACLGKGVMLANTDRFYESDASTYIFISQVAEKYKIQHQHMNIKSGGGEMGSLSLSFGVLGYSLTIPARYMHSPISVISKFDYESLISLMNAIIKDFSNFKKNV